MSADQKNEGEGNRTAAREFNAEQKRFAESGKVEPAARDAARAVQGKEGEALREAERLGKSHARGEDPAVRRDTSGR
jgi:hypothetical protein